MSLMNFISEKAKIGKDTIILNFVYVGDDAEIGDNVKIEHGAKIYEGCIIGSNSIIGANAVLRPNTQIGEHSIFGSLSVCVGDTKIGDWTTIHDNCHVTSGMTIGSSVFIGPMFTSANTPKMSKGKFGYPNTTHDPRNSPIIEEIPIMLPDELRDKNQDIEFLKRNQSTLPEKIIKQASPWHL